MIKHFYSHLIEMEPVLTTLDKVVVTDKEKKELLTILHTTTHFLVTDVVLTELKTEHKKKFMHHVARDEHDKIWELFKDYNESIERKIKQAIRDVHMGMIDDVKKISNNRKKSDL